MSLSTVLQELRAKEQSYQPSPDVKRFMQNKTLTTLVAPTAVGKSTLIARIVERGGPEFSESYSVVTRARRPDDPAGYMTLDEGYTVEHVRQMIQQGRFTHYTVNPNGNIYGSLPESFPAPYNLLPCVPTILPVVQQIGFSIVHVVYIVTSAHDWSIRLNVRRNDPAYAARLEEAIESLTWAIKHASDIYFVENASDKLDEAADNILGITKQSIFQTIHQDQGIALAHEMMTLAQSELNQTTLSH